MCIVIQYSLTRHKNKENLKVVWNEGFKPPVHSTVSIISLNSWKIWKLLRIFTFTSNRAWTSWIFLLDNHQSHLIVLSQDSRQCLLLCFQILRYSKLSGIYSKIKQFQKRSHWTMSSDVHFLSFPLLIHPKKPWENQLG